MDWIRDASMWVMWGKHKSLFTSGSKLVLHRETENTTKHELYLQNWLRWGFSIFFFPHQFACKWLRSLSFALFLTAVWLRGEDNPRLTIALSHAKEELSFSHRTEGGRQLAEMRLSPPLPAYWWPWGNQEEVLSSQLPCCCYHWQTPYQPCVWATWQQCVCVKCLSLSKSQDKPPSHYIQLLSSVTLQGSWIIKISLLKSCASILPSSNTGCFQSVFGFHHQSASFKSWRKQEAASKDVRLKFEE